MSGRKNYRELRERIRSDPERRKRIEEASRAYEVLLRLAELRESCGVTQTQLAERLGVSQPNVSKIEGKDDLYLSTLWNYVAALGGHLEVKAVFPDEILNLLTTPDLKGTVDPLIWALETPLEVFNSQIQNLSPEDLLHIEEGLLEQVRSLTRGIKRAALNDPERLKDSLEAMEKTYAVFRRFQEIVHTDLQRFEEETSQA